MAGITENTVLMLHMDESTVPTNFYDSSPINQTINQHGNTTQTTDQFKFERSAYFDGSSYLSVPDSGDDLELGSGEFTVDLWFYPTTAGSGWQEILGTWNDGQTDSGIMLGWYPTDGTVRFLWSTGSGQSTALLSNTGVITTGQWYHIAAVRNNTNNTIKLYLNGTEVDSADSTGVTIDPTALTFHIGARAGNQLYKYEGYLDEVRITKEAVWTTNFTPPTEAYSEGEGGSPLLCWSLTGRYSNGRLFSLQGPDSFPGLTNLNIPRNVLPDSITVVEDGVEL